MKLTPEDIADIAAGAADYAADHVELVFARADRELTEEEGNVIRAHLRGAISGVLKGVELS